MIRGLYSAATGMLAEQFVQDALAGNLANINTTGYKQDVPTFRALQEMALSRLQGAPSRGTTIGSLGMGTAFDHTDTDMLAGPVVQTENPLDVAFIGGGFFTIQTPQGERYTRDGHFHLQVVDKTTAYLANESGQYLLGQKGPINLAAAKEIVIDGQGNVLADRVAVDKLKLVDAPAAALKKQGGNLFTIEGTPTAAKGVLRQFSLEQSNVNAIHSMVKMITIQRAYEAAQRAITSQDETLGKAVNEVGRL
jgi:flagellar basal-body rod protein FlgF